MTTHINAQTVQSSISDSILGRGKMVIMTWFERIRTRRELAELPPYLLKDIGLTEADRFVESLSLIHI